MAGYEPLHISALETALVQEREEFLLPNDAYPVLENALVWRERIKRKQGLQLIGRLRRLSTAANLSAYSTIIGTNTLSIFTGLGVNVLQPNASIESGSITNITIVFPAPIGQSLTNVSGSTTLTVVGAGPITSATINYSTGIITITASAALGPVTPTFTGGYYPMLPVMGIRTREISSINNEQTIIFDTQYAYFENLGSGYQEFIPGTVWTGSDSNFFWSTNYWVDKDFNKIFWVTNFTTPPGDPIRYTNGTAWIDFAPIINAAGDTLVQCLCLLPFRSRLVAFNVFEKPAGAAKPYPNRIRWAEIGNPFSVVSAIVTTVVADAWRDDIRGKGGFLDIPTTEDIISVGFVRDNLVIYCERSTWQLRYTGRSIAPFQIEKVNSELGSESTFSAIQFDTSLVGIGDKGVVECDSFKSNRIDIKIPDLVSQFNNLNNGTKRVHGIRDFQERVAYWTYPYAPNEGKFPDRRLVYNYENDSWAIFTDSLTALGTFQPQTSITWAEADFSWESADFPWVGKPALFPNIIGGNQQGFISNLGALDVESLTTNDPTLAIQNITGNNTTPTVITSVNHNMQTGQVIKITGIIAGQDFASSLNNNIFGIVYKTVDSFELWKYNATTNEFSDPQTDSSTLVYTGGGLIRIRDNFSIVSKKFNFMDEGQNIQMGYLDILMDATDNGAITLNVYINYNDDSPVNVYPQNVIDSSNTPDTFFNTVISTAQSILPGISGDKYWQRVICPTRGNFITIQYKLSNSQMVGTEQEQDVQIDAQVLWVRRAGRMTNV